MTARRPCYNPVSAIYQEVHLGSTLQDSPSRTMNDTPLSNTIARSVPKYRIAHTNICISIISMVFTRRR